MNSKAIEGHKKATAASINECKKKMSRIIRNLKDMVDDDPAAHTFSIQYYAGELVKVRKELSYLENTMNILIGIEESEEEAL